MLNPLLSFAVPIYYCVCLGLSARRAAHWYWLTSPQLALACIAMGFMLFTGPVCLAMVPDISKGTNKKERAVHVRERGADVLLKGSRWRNTFEFLCGSRKQFQLV